MIKKWEVAPSPSEKNPARHKFLIKGEMRDIFLVVKKLGAICSRPEKLTGGFDFVIYLSKLEPDTLVKIKALASELSAPAENTSPRDASAPAGRVLEIESFETPRPKIRTSPDESVRIPAAAPADPAPQASPAPAGPPRHKARWPVELPLVPTHSFQTLVSGSHNRFAHAAAMAVVENPGVMYNPLLIFGVPGTGKTHFVHAVSYGLSSSIGQNNIFVTDGIKLSRGVDLAVKDGTISALSGALARAKVLIIDDIHLLMLTETNKKYISTWLNEFMTGNKQIVLTSVFPPKSLEGLEAAVGFQFTQGWMVDLKLPAPQAYKVILDQLLQGMDIRLSEDELAAIFVSRSVPFGEAMRALAAMKKLERFTSGAVPASSHAQLLDMLLGFSETASGGALTDSEYKPASAWKPSSSGSWFKWGIFYPKGMEREARYALYRTHERSSELGLKLDWEQLFLEEYNPDELYGVPFKVGDFSGAKGVNGVIILGPQPTSALGAQEAEFRHITIKILESFQIRGAWVGSGQIKSQAVYARALMDLM
ncbi:MAG: hypothetical protein A2X28_08105 [Elusimicrobia bacterium GWA2_56_46]|nr:MAG: hypothetical protein A2X28_08105 [Elusimicrobia bacterium GWA2_56_46]OGR54282.1 MAG: hypothetical protein A2X39_03605 [Elusimicrobia bacterium GWC2_56_31]HBB66985.1 hypothetical protein [Elusimicrobiota bacterium]HBW22433.1 hypothetical protein [Elusimicrobiota bacterium]